MQAWVSIPERKMKDKITVHVNKHDYLQNEW